MPFKAFWKPLDSGSQPAFQVFDKIYSSPSMLNAHRKVQRLKISDSDCTRPRCVAYFMFGSDGTVLGKGFSNVKGHPIYAFFGNESKYQQCKPASNTCFHVAHIPSCWDTITASHDGKPPSKSLITHLRRELMHEVWAHLLDDEFLYAWNNGIVIKCADGIERQVFPVLKFTQLITQRRSLWQQFETWEFAYSTKRINIIQEARRLIYDLGHSVQSKQIKALLQAESYVPTLIELGVWKSLFQHLIRLLHLGGSRTIVEFNKRFRSVSTFGSTIRMFSDDVASMGRLAARDFEDILQTPDEYTRRKKRQAAAQAPRSTQPATSKSKSKAWSLRRQQMANVYASSTSTLTRFVLTQICELQHALSRTSSSVPTRRMFVKQMTQIGDVSSALKRMDLELEQREAQLQSQIGDLATLPLDPEGLQSLLDGSPYTIGQTERSADLIPSITRWIYEQRHDDAMKSEDGSTPPHPFIYAKVLGIYHAKVSYGNVVPRREDFVHVRWLYYNTDEARQGGWDECRLDHIGYEQCYTDQDLLDSFDFVHPSDIIRAVHLIPNFQSGSSGTLLNFAKSIAHNSEEHWDWKYYYVNRFVDRDMLMRYLGGGIGHYRYAIGSSDVTLGSEQNEREGIEVSVETGEEGKNANMESKGKGSNGEESICLALDKVSDEEEPSVDKGPSEFKDDVSEDEMEGHAV
ncbi:hypothetical protein RHS01_11061 [Rhizoctonia solani]|uniref:Uncharacterized protein n=1 Tax=Rhizoctonia solani TaxID=456999 RepID=A0A8H7I2B9_9AGAM|nr:hypothetical protein RHS01_11061 [Rhizoctonia solani]